MVANLLFCIFFLPAVFSLTCYECQERRAGEWCSKPKKQQCNIQTSICLKYLHKEGKPGFPNHVLAKCELRTYYTQNKINACEQSVRLRNGALTITETCTCDQDLCNDATLSAAKMIEIEKSDGYKIQSTTPAAAEPMTPAAAHPIMPAPHHEEDDVESDHEEEPLDDTDGDEAVESPRPVVQQMDESSEEMKSAVGATEATKSVNGAEKIGASVFMIFLQLVLFWSLINPRW